MVVNKLKAVEKERDGLKTQVERLNNQINKLVSFSYKSKL
jgi:peptidoglycan hydrolase CwlO-like protein